MKSKGGGDSLGLRNQRASQCSDPSGRGDIGGEVQLGWGLCSGPPHRCTGHAGRAGWGRRVGAALAFASMPARRGQQVGDGAAAQPWVLVGAAASRRGPVLHFCSPFPSVGHIVSPLHPCRQECWPPKEPSLPTSPILARGHSDAQHQCLPRSCTKGCPGDAAGPPLAPHVEPGKPAWLGAAFSLVLRNVPGETISSDPKAWLITITSRLNGIWKQLS